MEDLLATMESGIKTDNSTRDLKVRFRVKAVTFERFKLRFGLPTIAFFLSEWYTLLRAVKASVQPIKL